MFCRPSPFSISMLSGKNGWPGALAWVQVPALLLTSHVTLGGSLALCGPQFLLSTHKESG
jgi:hypothetical protein